MSSAKGSSSGLNPKRASGDLALNPKRASGGALKPKATTPTAAAAAAAAPAKKKSPTGTSASVEAATRGVAGLKVDSPPAEKRRLGGVSRRRGDDDAPAASAPAPAAAASSSSSSSSSTLSAAKANQARRRLSITAGKEDASKLDGHSTDSEVKDPLTKVLKSMAAANAAPAAGGANTAAAGASASSTASAKSAVQKRRTFSHYSSLSKVGYVPFNPNKVNQDRSIEVVKFGGSDDKAFFGVFDGHGALGHEVSSFLVAQLPAFFLKQANLDAAPHAAIEKAFVDCNVKLASSSIDCTFSGSTGIVVYIANGKMYSCNAGDSRAVLARATPGDTKLTAVPLSDDQKPERPDEKRRILEKRGRVEACKGAKGEDIGPPRVWLSHHDVPGQCTHTRESVATHRCWRCRYDH